MSSDKTIVILTPGFPIDESDSTCLPMQQQLVSALKRKKGFNIIVLTFQYPYHRQTYQWHGITVIPFNGQNRGGIQRLLNRRKILAAIKQIHNRQTIHGMLSFWYGECAAVGKISADRFGIPHFCWLLGQDVKKNNKYPGRVRLDPDRLIAVSDATREEFEMNHEIRPRHVITPGVDVCLFDQHPQQRTIDIFGAGSLIPLKNFETFVSVVVALKKDHPDIKAELAGKGPEYQKLKELIITHGLQDNLKLLGELGYADVLEKMQRTRVFLHPSTTEGFSGVCMEALYAGAHVVSFCKPMQTDFPQWYIAGSPEEMVSQAAKLLQHAGEQKSVLISSIDDTAEKFLQLFS